MYRSSVFRLTRYLLPVAERLNVNRLAQVLPVSQPILLQRVRC